MLPSLAVSVTFPIPRYSETVRNGWISVRNSGPHDLPLGALWALKFAGRKEGMNYREHFTVVQIFLSAGNTIRLKLHIYKIQGRQN